MTTDMGRDMTPDMDKVVGTVFLANPFSPDPISLSLFL